LGLVKLGQLIFETHPKLDGGNVAVEEQAKPLPLKLLNPNWAAKSFSVGLGHRVHHANRHLRASSGIPMLESFSAWANFLKTVQQFQEIFF
jgi:hypothetical protein